jgi:hypothetical protein
MGLEDLTNHHLQNIRRLDLRAKVDVQQAVLLVQRGDRVSHDGSGVGIRVADGGAGDERDYCYLGGRHLGRSEFAVWRGKGDNRDMVAKGGMLVLFSESSSTIEMSSDMARPVQNESSCYAVIG